MNLFNYFWKKKDKLINPNKPEDETYIDIIISLNKNRQVDFSLFLDDKIQSIDIDPKEYSVLCGEFLDTVLSKKTKKDTVDILNEQIRNENNSQLINNIISIMKIMDIRESNNIGDSQFIRPSEVFAKYVS